MTLHKFNAIIYLQLTRRLTIILEVIMQLFSIENADTVTIEAQVWDSFLTEARNKLYFDEDTLPDLVYYLDSLYRNKGSILKKTYRKQEFFIQAARLLDHVAYQEIAELNAHELNLLLQEML